MKTCPECGNLMELSPPRSFFELKEWQCTTSPQCKATCKVEWNDFTDEERHQIIDNFYNHDHEFIEKDVNKIQEEFRMSMRFLFRWFKKEQLKYAGKDHRDYIKVSDYYKNTIHNLEAFINSNYANPIGTADISYELAGVNKIPTPLRYLVVIEENEVAYLHKQTDDDSRAVLSLQGVYQYSNERLQYNLKSQLKDSRKHKPHSANPYKKFIIKSRSNDELTVSIYDSTLPGFFMKDFIYDGTNIVKLYPLTKREEEMAINGYEIIFYPLMV